MVRIVDEITCLLFRNFDTKLGEVTEDTEIKAHMLKKTRRGFCGNKRKKEEEEGEEEKKKD